MFYVDKNTIPRHWFVAAGYVNENTGDLPPEDDSSILTYVGDENTAKNLAYTKAKVEAEKTVSIYQPAVDSKLIALAAFLRLGRAKENREWCKEKIAQVRQDAESIKVTVESIPDLIPVKGERLGIEQKLYKVLPTLEIKEVVVVDESINYYNFNPEGSAAYYTLSDKSSVTSELDKSNKQTNAPVFKTKAKAQGYVIDKATAEIDRLQQILEKTRG